MRNFIDMITEGVDQIKTGKFWYDTKTGEVSMIDDHHAISAFDIPVLHEIISANLSHTKASAKDARIEFTGDGRYNDEAYIEVHDEIIPLLLSHGFVRGSAGTYPDRNLSLEFNSSYEKKCRIFAQDWGAQSVYVEVTDKDESAYLSENLADQWYRGKPLRTIFPNSNF